MPDIKTKPKNELKIKKFDGATIYKQKFKSNLISINSKTNNIKNFNNEENTEIDFGINQIEEKAKASGAIKAYVEDLREEFITTTIYQAIKAETLYENRSYTLFFAIFYLANLSL